MQNNCDLLERHERDLVREAQAGSEAAFAELLRRSAPRLRRAAKSILDSVADVEDAVQIACWKAYEHLSTFRQDSSFYTWSTSIVVNQAAMALRQQRRTRFVSIDEEGDGRPGLASQLASTQPGPETSYGGDELVGALRLEIRRLPALLRQVMILHMEDLTVAEVADRLGLTVAATKTRLLRGRQELQNRMRRYAQSAVVSV